MTLAWGLVLMGFGLVKWGPLLEYGIKIVARSSHNSSRPPPALRRGAERRSERPAE